MHLRATALAVLLAGCGTAAPAPTAPPTSTKPRLAIDPTSDEFRPHLPPALQNPGESHFATLNVCVLPTGAVNSVRIVSATAHAAADEAIVAAVKRWRYTAFTPEGGATERCHDMRYELKQEPLPEWWAPGTSGEQAVTIVKPGTAKLAINPVDAPYRVKVPPSLAVAGARYWSMVKVCVSATGEVFGVKIIKSAHPALDRHIVEALARWRFKPHLDAGRAVPFCSPFRYEVRAD